MRERGGHGAHGESEEREIEERERDRREVESEREIGGTWRVRER